MGKKGLGLGLFFSSLLILGACASKTEVASTDAAAHQCSAECKHEKDHQCSADCKAKKGTAATAETCTKHADHQHVHSKTCGHKSVKHGDHMDYMHDGHQHNIHGDHVDEHKAVKAAGPTTKTNS